MHPIYSLRTLSAALLLSFMLFLLTAPLSSFAAGTVVSGPFAGPAVDGGTVVHSIEGSSHVLTLSDDFSIHQEPPDPHWRVIDSAGNVFLLQKLNIKDGRINNSIALPAYIRDVAKVQMWCAFAEVVLGEASFAKPITLKHRGT